MGSGPAVRHPLLSDLFGVDVRSLALLRVGVGSLLLIDLLQRSRWIAENYSQRGVLPDDALAALGSAPFPSVHLLLGTPGLQTALFGVAAAFAFMLLVGWHTRAACVASWYLLVSLHARNPLILDGGDLLLALVLFWCMFLPLGATFSLDARRRPWSGDERVLSPASAALLLQFAVVYLGAGITKTGPEWRVDGTAILYVMNQSYWTMPLGEVLAGYPGLMRLLTFAAVAFEVVAPLLLFCPWATARVRTVMIPAFWIFQHSLGLTIQLGVFPWICSVAILPFVPTALWDRLARRTRGVPVLHALAAQPLRPEAEAGGGAATGPTPAGPARVAQGALLLLVGLVFYSSVAMVEPRLVPGVVHRVLMVPRLSQSWGVYAPGPGMIDYRFARTGSLAGGAEVDLDLRLRGARWARVNEIHRDYRFKIYVQAVQEKDIPPLRDRYGRWLCREWNAEATGSERLEHVRFHIEAWPILPEGGRGPLRTRLIVDQSCSDRQRKRVKSGERFSAKAR